MANSSWAKPAPRPPAIAETSAPGYLSLRGLAVYSSLSVRTLRKALVDPVDPLPHFRPGGKIVVARVEFDAWLERRRGQDAGARGRQLDALVEDVMAGLRV